MRTDPTPRLKLKDLLTFEPVPQTDVEQKLCLEQQRYLVGLGILYGISTILISTTAAAIFLLYHPVWKVALWYVPLVLYSVFLINTTRRMRGKQAPTRTNGRLMRMSEYGCIFIGAMYGSTFFVFYAEDQTFNFYIIALISGFCGSLTGFMSSFPRQISKFIISAIVPLLLGMFVIQYGMTGHELHHGLLHWGFMFPITVGLTVYFYCAFSNHERMVDLTIVTERSRASEELLRNAVDATGDALAIFDSENQCIVANSMHQKLAARHGMLAPAPDAQSVKLDGEYYVRKLVEMEQGRKVQTHINVTEATRRELELIAAKREADAAEVAKLRFLASMTSSLNDPISVIYGCSSLMRTSSKVPLEDQDVRTYGDSIYDAVTTLKAFTEKMLRHSAAINPELEPDLQAISIGEAFDRLKSNLQAQIGTASTSVKFEASDDLPLLRIDPKVMQRVVVELVKNAIKHGGSGRDVIVKASVRDGDRLLISVRDFGPGMDDAQVTQLLSAKIDDPSNKALNAVASGTGFVLARGVARLNGGDVLVNSRPNAGTNAMYLAPRKSIQRHQEGLGEDTFSTNERVA